MVDLLQCACYSYPAMKQLVKRRFDEYDALLARFKSSERRIYKIAGHIDIIRMDIARKAQSAIDSPMIKGNKRNDLIELGEDFKDLSDSYKGMRASKGCPCCLGMEEMKEASNEMLESATVLRESFAECMNNTLTVPHDILTARRVDFEEKSAAACDLRLESIDKVQEYVQFHRDYFAAFLSLQDAFNAMAESVSMHNALLLLGEESLGSGVQKKHVAKKEGKKGKTAAKASAKCKRVNGQSKPTKPSKAAASTEEASDEEAAVVSEVAHSNPFAALETGGEGSAADSASAHDSDSASQHSSSSTAEVLHTGADGRNIGGAADFPSETERQLDELELAAQRQAILNRLQCVSAAESAQHLAQGNGHATNGHLGSARAPCGQLRTAQKLKASFNGSQLAVRLASHLCCPITGELMVDPVVAMDGHTYERLAIESWFEEQPAGLSIKTKKRLPSKRLLANKNLKSLVAQLTG